MNVVHFSIKNLSGNYLSYNSIYQWLHFDYVWDRNLDVDRYKHTLKKDWSDVVRLSEIYYWKGRFEYT